MAIPLLVPLLWSGGGAASAVYIKNKWDALWTPEPQADGSFQLSPLKIAVWLALAFVGVRVLLMIKQLIMPSKKRR